MIRRHPKMRSVFPFYSLSGSMWVIYFCFCFFVTFVIVYRREKKAKNYCDNTCAHRFYLFYFYNKHSVIARPLHHVCFMKETNKEVCTAAVVTDNASLISYIYTHLLHTKYQTMRMRLLLNHWPVKKFVFLRTKCTLKYDCNSKYHIANNISIKIFLVIYGSLILSHFDYCDVAWVTVNRVLKQTRKATPTSGGKKKYFFVILVFY